MTDMDVSAKVRQIHAGAKACVPHQAGYWVGVLACVEEKARRDMDPAALAAVTAVRQWLRSQAAVEPDDLGQPCAECGEATFPSRWSIGPESSRSGERVLLCGPCGDSTRIMQRYLTVEAMGGRRLRAVTGE